MTLLPVSPFCGVTQEWKTEPLGYLVSALTPSLSGRSPGTAKIKAGDQSDWSIASNSHLNHTHPHVSLIIALTNYILNGSCWSNFSLSPTRAKTMWVSFVHLCTHSPHTQKALDICWLNTCVYWPNMWANYVYDFGKEGASLWSGKGSCCYAAVPTAPTFLRTVVLYFHLTYQIMYAGIHWNI